MSKFRCMLCVRPKDVNGYCGTSQPTPEEKKNKVEPKGGGSFPGRDGNFVSTQKWGFVAPIEAKLEVRG